MFVWQTTGEAGKAALQSEAVDSANSTGGIERKSTRVWSEESGYDAEKLFNKVSYCVLVYGKYFLHKLCRRAGGKFLCCFMSMVWL